jgi:phosphoribosylanthranilate isomerase
MAAEVKICGLSTPESLDAALDAGADFVGLVFFPKSPRNVTLEQAATLANRARGRSKIVTLVVDADDALLSAIAGEVRPDLIQAHGAETPARIAEITRLTGKPVIKAIRVKDDADIAAMMPRRRKRWAMPFRAAMAMPSTGACWRVGNARPSCWRAG